MAFPLSPGVVVNEVDLTTIVPGVSVSTGAIAGLFRWGPIGVRTLVDSEADLKNQFGGPSNFNAETWFSAANFLAYSNDLEVVRAGVLSGNTPIMTVSVQSGNATVTTTNTVLLVDGMTIVSASNTDAINVGTGITVINSTAFSISANTDALGTDASVTVQFMPDDTSFNAIVNTAAVSNLASQIVASEDDFNNSLANDDFDENVVYIARWAGAMGNSLRISSCDSAKAFSSNIDLTDAGVFTGTLNSAVGSNTLVLSFSPNTATSSFNVNTFNTFVTAVHDGLTVGDYIVAGNTTTGVQSMKTSAIGDASLATLGANSSTTVNVGSGSNTVQTTASGFSSVSNGQWIAIYSNTVAYSTFLVTAVTDGNTIVLANVGGFTNTASNWAIVAANGSIDVDTVVPYRKSQNTSSTTLSRSWEFKNAFTVAPGQSDWVRLNGNNAANDEVHVVVVDNLGKFTGVPGTVLEKYSGLSRAVGSKSVNNTDNYFRSVLNTDSSYIWNVNDVAGSYSNGASNVTSSSLTSPFSSTFNFGADGLGEGDVDISTITAGWDQFESTEDSDVGLLIAGKSLGDGQLANYIIDNIAEIRKDCVVFISPGYEDVVNQTGQEMDNCVDFRNNLSSTSYGFMDSGYKYQYDKYNDVYRYIPLNGDIAGLAARTDQTNDAWWSFAGLNRGIIKNIVRLAWNPRQAARDVLYPNGINPVVTFQGNGTVLYGDNTLLSKPSAFGSINVRRLFIEIEKSISKAAKYTLFEFNDAFTRAQFRNLVIPYLRDVQGRRGINNFQVICDGTNNTGEVIDEKGFVADIYVQPERAVNWITLNFINTPNGVAFSEVTGTTV